MDNFKVETDDNHQFTLHVGGHRLTIPYSSPEEVQRYAELAKQETLTGDDAPLDLEAFQKDLVEASVQFLTTMYEQYGEGASLYPSPAMNRPHSDFVTSNPPMGHPAMNRPYSDSVTGSPTTGCSVYGCPANGYPVNKCPVNGCFIKGCPANTHTAAGCLVKWCPLMVILQMVIIPMGILPMDFLSIEILLMEILSMEILSTGVMLMGV
jgi:hypothetical protein